MEEKEDLKGEERVKDLISYVTGSKYRLEALFYLYGNTDLPIGDHYGSL